MKKIILIICGIILISGNVFGQSNGIDKSTETQKMENYTSEVLIVGKWGSGRGEYKCRIWEGDLECPKKFIVTNKEHVYVLDRLNNRVHHYNKKGKLVSEIPVSSYKLVTSAGGNKWNGGYSYSIFSLNKLEYIDGNIFLIQTEQNGVERKENILKLKKGKFIKVNKQEEKKKIYKIRSRSIIEEMKQHFKNDKKFKVVKFLRRDSMVVEWMFYDGIRMQFPIFDKDNNLWFFSDGIIKKYSPKGNLLFEVSSGKATRIVSKQGNLYLMDFYSTKSCNREGCSFEKCWEGIGIKKFTLVK